ncbi:MAG: hypothetical protein ACRDXD_14835 [Acidimicrobiia bacterium]
MSVFEGKLRVPGQYGSDVGGSVALENDRLVVVAGAHQIGDWPAVEVSVVLEPGGFHLRVGDDELIIQVTDPAGFAEALEASHRGRKGRRARPRKDRQKKERAASARPAARSRPQRRPLPAWWKWAGLGLLALVGLALFVPALVVLLLMLAGGTVLIAGTLAIVDPEVAGRLPGTLAPNTLLRVGLGVIALAVLVAVLT